MSETNIVPWQPATLPEGWHVVGVDVYREVSLDGWRPPTNTMRVVLQHVGGWRTELTIVTHGDSPATVNDAALTAYLNALTETGGMGSVLRLDSEYQSW